MSEKGPAWQECFGFGRAAEVGGRAGARSAYADDASTEGGGHFSR